MDEHSICPSGEESDRPGAFSDDGEDMVSVLLVQVDPGQLMLFTKWFARGNFSTVTTEIPIFPS